MLSTGDQRGFLVSCTICELWADQQAYIVRSDATKFGEVPVKGEAQPSAEHQVVQIEETDTSPSTTSCFLESEEGRVSLKYLIIIEVLTI